MLDDIREWISDNLRYILLGLAGIVVIFLLVTVIRAVSGGSSKSSKKDNKAETSQTDTSNTDAAQTSSTGDAQTATGEIQESTDESLLTLIKSYYQAIAAQDVETVRVLTDQLSADGQAKIESENDIESYSDIKVYTAAGPETGTYVVYAAYNYKYRNFDTQLPGLSQLYVCTAEDGSYYIAGGAMTETVKSYIEAENASSGVTQLMQTTKTAYDAALAADPNLSSYLNTKGQTSNASNALNQADGTELTIKQNCNVRAEASTSSTKLGQLAAGTKVTKTGSEAEWVKIDYNGQTAYVRWDMFE